MSRRTKGQEENFATPFGNQLIGAAFAAAVLFTLGLSFLPVQTNAAWRAFWNALFATFVWFMEGWWMSYLFWVGMATAALFVVLIVFFAVKDLYTWTRSLLSL